MARVQLPNITMNVDVVEGVFPADTLFLHGNLASNIWWEPALEIWKKQAKPGYTGRAIMAEWRGCGGTDAPADEAGMAMDQMGQDYVDLLNKMGIKKVNVVTHSTGGLIALFAMLKAPQLFDRVFFLDPVAATGVQFGPEMFDAFTQMSKDREFCAAIMGGTIYNNDPSKPFFQKIVDASFGVKSTVWHGVPKALYNVNILEDIKKLPQHVFVAHGEHDNLLDKNGSIAMANALPNGKYYEIPGCGHCANYENPELFARLVTDFLFLQR